MTVLATTPTRLSLLLVSLGASLLWTCSSSPTKPLELLRWNSSRRFTNQQSCPHPYEPSFARRDTLEVDYAQCTRLPSSSTDFDLRVCALEAATTCNSFAVIVRSVDTNRCIKSAKAASIAGSSESAERARGKSATDIFEIRIDGAQSVVRSWPTQHYEQICEWRYDVQLATGGDFMLDISRIVGGGESSARPAEEHLGVKTWLPLTGEPLLEAPILSSDLGSLTCPEECPSYSFDEHGQLDPAPPVAIDAVSVCSSDEAPIVVYLPDAEPQEDRAWHPHVIPYRGTPVGCRMPGGEEEALDALTLDESIVGELDEAARALVVQGATT